MLATIIRPLLKEIKRKSGTLNKNGFARRLVEFIIDNRTVPDNSGLLSLLYRSDIPEELNYSWKNKYPDRRIKALFLKDIRQYCLAHNNESKAKFYYLDFQSDDKVTSAIFQGANGTGKSTVFSALEYLYKGNSEIAASHGYKDNQINSFFRSVGALLKNVQINASFVKEEEIKDNRVQGYELPAAFCSECDYFEISRNWKDIDYYIAYLLGNW